MREEQRDRVLSSLLWGGLAAAGQHTMLFLSVVGRIHVRFEHEAPQFYVDPRGPIALSKDAALRAVWLMTAVYGLVVVLLVYFSPRVRGKSWVPIGLLTAVLAIVAALAEPLWGLVVLADAAALYPLLSARRTSDRS